MKETAHRILQTDCQHEKAIGIDEISIRNGHTYRIVVSDLIRRRPVWFGGEDRKEASMVQCYDWLGEKKRRSIRLAVMDMWKPCRHATVARAPQAAILFDTFHSMRHLGDALDGGGGVASAAPNRPALCTSSTSWLAPHAFPAFPTSAPPRIL